MIQSVRKEAEQRLSAADEEKAFHLRTGERLRSLYDLKQAAESMDQSTFGHHVSEGKNDFSKWVREVHRDHELATDIQNVQSAKELHEHMTKRISALSRLRSKDIFHMHHFRLAWLDFAIAVAIGLVIGIVFMVFF